MSQQNPVTVVKGDVVINDVYLSDLPAWFEDGFDIIGQPRKEIITPKKKTVTT